MLIDAVLNPAEIALLPQRDLERTTCVVFDVLRATSSIVTGLANGVGAIHPVKTIEEAHEVKARRPEALLAGERHGDPIHGFSIGNSPFEFRDCKATAIITTTTNGTIALRACEAAQHVFVGALLNLPAVAKAVLAVRPETVVIVCAGTFAELALEDVYACGRLIQLLKSEAPELTDAAQTAVAVAGSWPGALEALRASKNGKVLARNGRSEEVEWCAKEGHLTAVGKMEAGVIRPWLA